MEARGRQTRPARGGRAPGAAPVLGRGRLVGLLGLRRLALQQVRQALLGLVERVEAWRRYCQDGAALEEISSRYSRIGGDIVKIQQDWRRYRPDTVGLEEISSRYSRIGRDIARIGQH